MRSQSTTTARNASSPPAAELSGFADRPAATILLAAIRALASTATYEAAGEIVQDHELAAATIDVQRPSSVSESIVNGVQRLHLIIVEGHVYINADLEFWEEEEGSASPSVIARLPGRWLRAPTADAKLLTGSLLESVSSRQLSTCLSRAVDAPVVTGIKTINGRRTVVLSTSGGLPGTGPADLYVELAPPHYPLRFQQTGTQRSGGTAACGDSPIVGDGQGLLNFSHFGDVTVSAPERATQLP